MAFRPVNTRPMDIKKEVGKQYQGAFAGKDDITTPMGAQVVWKFEAEDGTYFGIYGFTTLNMAMKSIKEGTLCRVTYQGQEEVMTKKFGKKMVHKCMVEVDDGGVETPEGAEIPF